MVNFNNLTKEELEKRLGWYDKKFGPYIGKRGVHNWKNLFRKPSFTDWVIMFMLVMALFIAWAYQHDIALCQQCLREQEQSFNMTTVPATPSPFPSLPIIKEEIEAGEET